MKILVTGAKGFAGRNLVENLKNIRDGKNRTRPNIQIEEIFEFDIDTDKALLNIIQSGFPIESRPYAVLGEKTGISEEEALEMDVPPGAEAVTPTGGAAGISALLADYAGGANDAAAA